MKKLINWDKYIKLGKFISTNGIELPYKWEFDKLDKNEKDKDLIIDKILLLSLFSDLDLVAINSVHPRDLKKNCTNIYYPNIDALFKPQKFNRGYVIYDDVVTTGRTINRCINKMEFDPDYCICLIDRTKETKIKLNFKLISIKNMMKNGTI